MGVSVVCEGGWPNAHGLTRPRPRELQNGQRAAGAFSLCLKFGTGQPRTPRKVDDPHTHTQPVDAPTPQSIYLLFLGELGTVCQASSIEGHPVHMAPFKVSMCQSCPGQQAKPGVARLLRNPCDLQGLARRSCTGLPGMANAPHSSCWLVYRRLCHAV